MLEIKKVEDKVQLVDIDEMSVEELKNTYELMGSNLLIFQNNMKGIDNQITNYGKMIEVQQNNRTQEQKNFDLTVARMEKIRPFLKAEGVDVKKPENYLPKETKKNT